MTKISLALALFAGVLTPAYGQVRVDISLPQEQFLPGETLVAAVRITNRSGQKLHLGAEEDWLTFSVESRNSSVVAKLGEAPVQGEFDLDSSQVATKRVDVAPYFTLTQPGRYALTATVKIKAWNREINSQPKTFDVVRGSPLWEQEIGVPLPSKITNSTPEVRKYILEQANYLKGQLRLYMRLTDSSGARSYRVFPIGQMVSFSRPQVQVDKWSNLHVLYANGPHSFSYTVFNPDGDLMVREAYDFLGSRPKLKVDEEGKVSVAGGARRLTAQDLPRAEPAVSSHQEKP